MPCVCVCGGGGGGGFVLFNSISVISCQCEGDNERQCTMDRGLLEEGCKAGTARSTHFQF